MATTPTPSSRPTSGCSAATSKSGFKHGKVDSAEVVEDMDQLSLSVIRRDDDSSHSSERCWDLKKTEHVAIKMRERGFRMPADLLPMLRDTKKFHETTRECELDKNQSAKLWKALSALEVLLHPIKATDGMEQVRQMFEDFCDTQDSKNRPSISKDGLLRAMQSLNAQHGDEDVERVLARIDVNGFDLIDVDTFLAQFELADIELWHRVARQQLTSIRAERREEAREVKFPPTSPLLFP